MKNSKPPVFAVILAGGSGTRLWPLSRETWPKQLLSLIGNHTLLQETVRRTSPIVPPENQMIVTNREYLLQIQAQVKEIYPEGGSRTMAEPFSRNTAPAIFLAARHAQATGGKDAVLLVLPSDHLISGEKDYCSDLQIAINEASKGALLTFGISPTSPETGFGYIEVEKKFKASGVYPVKRFVEKPDLEKAKSFCSSGKFLWNSGMFAFHVETLFNEAKSHCPELYRLFQKLDANHWDKVTQVFEQSPSISIDYAIMEKTKKAFVIPGSFGWSDVGSWQKLFEVSDKDESGNVILGDHIALETTNSLIIGRQRTIATLGLKDMAVIDTPDALLVCPLEESQKVKDVVARLKRDKRKEYSEHVTVHRPWGSYTVLEEGPRYKMKRIVVKPGKRLSLQRHAHRSEHWVVVSGTAGIGDGTKDVFLAENQSTFIPPTQMHRLSNPGRIPLQIIEIQVGSYLEEDDIERFDDDFGRN